MGEAVGVTGGEAVGESDAGVVIDAIDGEIVGEAGDGGFGLMGSWERPLARLATVR